MQIETQGLHPATELCLMALQWLQEREDFATVLDMGCGNGILSVICAHIWPAQVLAADISEKAVADTTVAIAAEGLSDSITPIRSDGFHHALIHSRAPYDLILINLLAEPIASWAPEVKKHLREGGYVYLGGILQWKSEGIRELYEGFGFEIAQEFSNSPWVGYVLRYRTVTN
jgi:ribosomal protein L11 methyltransferase